MSLTKIRLESPSLYFPRWLVKKHRDIRATSVLTRIRMTSEEDIQEELREIQQAVDRNPRTEGLWEMWRPLFTWRIFQRYVLRIGGKREGGEVTPVDMAS